MSNPIRAALACTVLASLSSLCAAADHGRTQGSSSVSPSGAATYSIPIWTPPGPNGVQPSIGLSYNSNSGNGLAGVGWNLSVGSSISRCPRTIHQDGSGGAISMTLGDRFCLDGNRLRLSSGTYGMADSVYLTELADYSRIKAYGSAGSGPLYFIVEAKNGLRYEFGNSLDSREAPGGSTVLRWLLNKVSDRSGNNYVVTYTNAAGTRIPDAIRWTPTIFNATTYRYEAKFNYDTNRIDLDSSFTGTSGHILINRGRLNNVQIKSAGVVVRKYVLEYDTSTVTSRSLLRTVKECADDDANNCFLPITFTYQPGMAGLTAGAGTPPASGNNYVYAARYDFNGDGKDDIAYQVGTAWWVAFGANGGFSAAYNTGLSGASVSIDQFLPNGRDALAGIISNTLHVARWDDATSAFVVHNTDIVTSVVGLGADYNGDGLADLVTKHSNNLSLQVRMNISTGSGNPSFNSSLTTTATLTSWWRYAGVLGSSTGLDYVDLNGDGREDLNVQILWANDNPPAEGDSAVVTVLGTSSGFQVPATSQWVFNAAGEAPSLNFNGDSCTDRFVNNTVQIAPCSDAWGSTISAPATPKILMDWDGDGKTDILADIGGTFGVYRSTGNGFSALITTSISSAGTFFDADVDGDGLDDLVKINGSSAISYWTHTAGGAAPTYATNIPDLLQTASDGFGVSATMNYVSTAWSNYDKGAAANYPLQENGSHIVVARATSSDGIGTTFNRDFFYVGSRRHAGRRASVGFQRFDTTDSRNSLISRTYFEQQFPVAGMVAQTELMQPNGTTTISREVFTNTSELLDNTANNERHFAYPSASTATRFELGGDWNGVLLRTITRANSFEYLGGTLYDQTVTVTEPSGANGLNAGGVWVTRIHLPLANLINDSTNWCLGRPGRTEVTRSHNRTFNTEITRTTSASWNATYCRPTQVIDEPGSGTLQVTTDIHYDRFGNVDSTTVTGIGMDPRTTSAVFADTTYKTGQFPLSVTNALSQTSYTSWNYDLAAPANATDPNGITTSWQYDSFGRRDRENRPDGTYSTILYRDCHEINFCPGQIKTQTIVSDHDSAGTLFARITTYQDGFGRDIGRYERSMHWVPIYTGTEYDALGRVYRTNAPCFSTNSDCNIPAWTNYGYDLLNRLTSESRPISDSNPATQTTTIDYQGLSTRVRDAYSKYSTKTMNAAGELARSTDYDGYHQNFDYDAFGNVKRVTDSATNALQNSDFNLRGMLTARTDMDMGAWSFVPNALGETSSQTDAKGQTTTFGFDLLGRLSSRTEAEGTSNFTWGVASDNTATNKYIGHLKSVSGPGYSETFTRDALGRLQATDISADTAYQIGYAYNSKGLLHSLTYPQSTNGCRLTVQFGYLYGHLTSVSNASNASQCGSTGETYWNADLSDAFKHVRQETLGNGLVIRSALDAVTGWVKSIKTGPTATTHTVQNLEYEWDLVGNLKKRIDGNHQGLTEEFFYDNLYRLDYTTLNGGTNLDMAYDLLGNITSKSDVGSYVYHASKKHQVTSAGGLSFGFDADGNMTSRGATSISWTSFNYPACIREGADCSGSSSAWSSFSYTPDRQYWRQVSNYPSGGEATTIYVGGLLEKVTAGSNTDYRHMIRAGGATIIVSRSTSGTNSVNYVTSDHLGSSSAITNSSGGIIVNSSFDAFGKRRGSNWTGNPSGGDWAAIASTTRRGYTEHSMLDNLGLIHMNGRVHDPVLGRFLSADPFIPDPMSTQSYNRYSYVQNNPLSMIDPSGFDDTNGPTFTCDTAPMRCNAFLYGVGPDCTGGGCLMYNTGAGADANLRGTAETARRRQPIVIFAPDLDPNAVGSTSNMWPGHSYNFWRVNPLRYFAGRAIGDMYAPFDQYGHNPLTGDYLTGEELNNAKFFNVITVGTAGISNAFTTAARSAPIVIGENMARVQTHAARVGGETFTGQGMAANRAWAQAARDAGRKVIDIGPDFKRRLDRFLSGERPESSVYGVEREVMKGYENVQKVWERAGKFFDDLTGGP